MEPRKPWKGTMTQRERFNAQMHYQSFDRTVNMEFGYWRENYQTWDIFLENNIKNEGDANRFFAFENDVTPNRFTKKTFGDPRRSLILIISPLQAQG